MTRPSATSTRRPPEQQGPSRPSPATTLDDPSTIDDARRRIDEVWTRVPAGTEIPADARMKQVSGR